MLKKLIPHKNVNTIYDIDVKALWEAGVRGIITDLDNTLVGAKDPNATPQLVNWFKLVQAMGYQIVIVSNNERSRVSKFAKPLSIPYISGAKKPTNAAFRRALEMMNVTPKQTVVIGDQLLTDVLGGNRMGLYTILVTPISLKDEGIFTKFNRNLEKMAFKWMKKKGFMPWEGR